MCLKKPVLSEASTSGHQQGLLLRLDRLVSAPQDTAPTRLAHRYHQEGRPGRMPSLPGEVTLGASLHCPQGRGLQGPLGHRLLPPGQGPSRPRPRAAALSHQTPRHQVSGAWPRRDHFSQAVKTLEGRGPRPGLDHPVVR